MLTTVEYFTAFLPDENMSAPRKCGQVFNDTPLEEMHMEKCKCTYPNISRRQYLCEGWANFIRWGQSEENQADQRAMFAALINHSNDKKFFYLFQMHTILKTYILLWGVTKYCIFPSKAVNSGHMFTPTGNMIPVVLFAQKYKHLQNQVLFTQVLLPLRCLTSWHTLCTKYKALHHRSL